MKINEVEQRVGVTKKNIRFYEDQGLLSPCRNKENGYRDYSEEDVLQLQQIKLLRRLAVPIEEIRKLQNGELSLQECFERHCITLNHEKHNVELMSDMCRKIAERESGLREMDAEKYLKELNEIEKGGVRFMDVNRTDIRRKQKRGAGIAAAVMIALIALYDVAMIIAYICDPTMPLPILLLMVLPATAVIAGIAIALRERMKEIDKGEAYEAADY